MYIYHLREVFLPGYGWFEGNILYFNTLIRAYHIFVYTTDHGTII